MGPGGAHVEPEGTDVVSRGVPGSSGGRWTQTSNSSVRRCHRNPGEQSSAVWRRSVCQCGEVGRGNRGLWIRLGGPGGGGARGGWTPAWEGLPTGSGAQPLSCGEEGAMPGRLLGNRAEGEPCSLWFEHGSSLHCLCGLGTREPQLSPSGCCEG